MAKASCGARTPTRWRTSRPASRRCGRFWSNRPLSPRPDVWPRARSGQALADSSPPKGALMAGKLEGRMIAILATDGVEQVELVDCRKALDEAGATTRLVSIKDGEIQGMNHL